MILFVAGIDTGIGKTVATGRLAAWFQRVGCRVITHKLVQTGCAAVSEDILEHRRWMGLEALPEDEQGLTCPAVYPFPASPHLAARLAGASIRPGELADSAERLNDRYELVLVEGAGGLRVPLTPTTTMIDLIAQRRWPVILVTSCRLGSINHTLLSFDALSARQIPLAAVIYNLHQPAPAEIVADTRDVIRSALAAMNSNAPLIDLPGETHPHDTAGWEDAQLNGLLTYAGR